MGEGTQKTLPMDAVPPPPPPPPSQAPPPPPEDDGGNSRRYGGGKEFLVDVVLPLFLGLLLTAGLYTALNFIVFPEWLRKLMMDRVRELLMERTWVPYACTFLLFWHLSSMFVRILRIRPEAKVLNLGLIPPGMHNLTPGDVSEITQRAIEVEVYQGERLLTRRILLAMAHLKAQKDTSEIGDLLRRRADADRVRAANAYAIPKFLFWAIPILGFVGTVMGIGMAVGNLGGSLKGVKDIGKLTDSLGLVSSSLGVAFDTTLVALVMSIVAMLVQTLVRQQELWLLANIEDYITYQLQSRLGGGGQTDANREIVAILQRALKTDERILEEIAATKEGVDHAVRQLPAALLEGTQSLQSQQGQELLKFSAALQGSLEQSVQAVRERLDAVADMHAQTAQDLLHVIEQGTVNLAQQVHDQMLEGSKESAAELERARAALLGDISRQGTGILEQTTELFKEAVEPLQSSLQQLVLGLDGLTQEGQNLSRLNATLQDSVDQVNRVQNLDQCLQSVSESFARIQPLLDRLSQPIPVRLTLSNMDFPDTPQPDGGDGGGGATPPAAPSAPSTLG